MSDVNIYAEEGLLASVMLDLEALPDVMNTVLPSDFVEPRHRKIFHSMCALASDNIEINIVSIGRALREEGVLSEVGGVEFLANLFDPANTFASVADPVTYAEVVKEESLRRELADTGAMIASMSRLDSGVSIEQTLSNSQLALQRIGETALKSDSMTRLSDATDMITEKLKERSSTPTGLQGVPSGFIDLDKLTTGFMGGQFIIIAARPATGKSTLAVDFLRNAAFKAGYTAMIFSLEMDRSEIMDRIISAESNVLLENIRSGELSDDEWVGINGAIERIKDVDILIDDTPNITLEHIRAACLTQLRQPEGLDLIVVDYIQLMRSSGRVESRQQEVSEFSRSLKLLARELGRPVVALSQLNRGPEQRSDKRPQMSDMRESGSLEQDADIVILLHRQDAEGDGQEQSLLLLEKNRNGPAGVAIRLAPLLEYAKFGNGSGMFPPEESGYDQISASDIPMDEPGFEGVDAPILAAGAASDPVDSPPWSDPVDDIASTADSSSSRSVPSSPVPAVDSPRFPAADAPPVDYGEEPIGSVW